jgi:hypothetical protein
VGRGGNVPLRCQVRLPALPRAAWPLPYVQFQAARCVVAAGIAGSIYGFCPLRSHLSCVCAWVHCVCVSAGLSEAFQASLLGR